MENVTNVFRTRLRALRGSKSQIEVAKALNISRAALSYYESGERVPDINVLFSMAKYFNVSSDYLLGITDIEKTDIDAKAIADKTGLSARSIEFLKYNKKSCDLLGKEYNEKEIHNPLYSYLELQTINLLIGGASGLLSKITDFLFVEFTHFSNYEDGEYYYPISDLELYDERLDISYSEDYDFYSKAILFSLQYDLQSFRMEYLLKLNEFFRDENRELSVSEMHQKIKLFFSQQRI